MDTAQSMIWFIISALVVVSLLGGGMLVASHSYVKHRNDPYHH